MNLPNKLTILRILLVPIMVIIPYFNITGDFLGIPYTYLIIDFIFIIASITDKLDGSSKIEFEEFLESSSKKASEILKLILRKIK